MRTLWEYDIFVPTINDGGTRYATDLLATWEERLIEKFGGLTRFSYRNEGSWRFGGAGRSFAVASFGRSLGGRASRSSGRSKSIWSVPSSRMKF